MHSYHQSWVLVGPHTISEMRLFPLKWFDETGSLIGIGCVSSPPLSLQAEGGETPTSVDVNNTGRQVSTAGRLSVDQVISRVDGQGKSRKQ